MSKSWQRANLLYCKASYLSGFKSRIKYINDYILKETELDESVYHSADLNTGVLLV